MEEHTLTLILLCNIHSIVPLIYDYFLTWIERNLENFKFICIFQRTLFSSNPSPPFQTSSLYPFPFSSNSSHLHLNAHIPNTCRLSPISQFANKRDACQGACDLQVVTVNRHRTSRWWVTQWRNISRTDPVICHGGLPGFHRRELNTPRDYSGARASSLERFIIFAREITCNGCHGPMHGIRRFMDRIQRERRARQSRLSSHGSFATRHSNSTLKLHGLSKKGY